MIDVREGAASSVETGDPETLYHELRHLQQMVRNEPRSELAAEAFALEQTTRLDTEAWAR